MGPDGSLSVGDANNHRVRRFVPGGTISSVAGTGTAGYSGDGGPATAARLRFPRNVAFGPDGSLYIADDENYAVRRVTPAGIITTVAGTGAAGFSGDGGPATSAQLRRVRDVAVDAAGNVYIADSTNNSVRRVNAQGIITTVAGTQQFGYTGDGGPATAATLTLPRSVAVDPAGGFYIADEIAFRVRRVGPDGVISTIAGNGLIRAFPEGSAATQAYLNNPRGIWPAPDGKLYIADTGNNRIR
ncbi:MAG TPA: serine/threonine protein kinase, partial [Acidimicrobiia bacterium]|nr:serine/threonine protein kinase [Acidimicrobiia bacterium]